MTLRSRCLIPIFCSPAKIMALSAFWVLFDVVLHSAQTATNQSDGLPASASDDVVIYGGTPGGVAAAVAAADKGLSVVLVEPTNHIGGMISGGLVETDIGDRNTVGGFAKWFFDDVVNYYRDTYGPDSPELKACRDGLMYEPSVGEKIFDRVLAEKKVQVYKKYRLTTVQRNPDGNIASFTAENLNDGSRQTFAGRIFIDASYEGDLLAGAGVHNRIGREGRDEFNESLAGIAVGPDKGKADGRYQTYNFRVSITDKPGNVVPFPKPENYDPTWVLPMGERVRKNILKEFSDLLINGAERAGPNRKWDLNWGDLAEANGGYADGDWATRERIAARYRDHFLSGLWYLQNDPSLPAEWLQNMKKWGLPKDEFVDTGHFPHQMYIRQARRMVGEYVLTQNDLTQDHYKPDGVCAGSYGIDCHLVRRVPDGKRLLADFTPHYYVAPYDIPYRSLIPKNEPGQPKNLLVPVALSTTHVAYCSVRMEPVYMMLGQAAGNAAALALKDNLPVQEVDVKILRDVLRKEGALLDAAYKPQVRMSWTPERPKPGEKVTFTLVKDEVRTPLTDVWWDFEGNGRVAATGETATATFDKEKVYKVSLLVEDGEKRRQWVRAEVSVGNGEKLDVTVDDADAERIGRWWGTFARTKERIPDAYVGPGIRSQELTKAKPGDKTGITFRPAIPRTGRYEVSLAFRPQKSAPKNALVKIVHADGTEEIEVDQTKETTPFPFVSLGEFRFEQGDKATLRFSNPEAKKRAVVDAARWTWIGD